jgi:hypothetical protein
MTIIQIFNFFKKKMNFQPFIKTKKIEILNINPLILSIFVIFFSILFFTISSLINKKNEENIKNLS